MKVKLIKVSYQSGIYTYKVEGDQDAVEAFKTFKGEYAKTDEAGVTTTTTKFKNIGGEMVINPESGKWSDPGSELIGIMTQFNCSLAQAKEIQSLEPA